MDLCFVSKVNIYDFIQPPGVIVTQRCIMGIFAVVFFSSNQLKTYMQIVTKLDYYICGFSQFL